MHNRIYFVGALAFLLGTIVFYGYYNGKIVNEDEPAFLNVALNDLEKIETKTEDQHITISSDPDGHFRTAAFINDQKINMLVDTGASMVALSRKDAAKLGYYFYDNDFIHAGKSATDKIKYIEITLAEIEVAGIRLSNVPAAVVNNETMPALLGMSFINRLNRIEIRKDKLTIIP